MTTEQLASVINKVRYFSFLTIPTSESSEMERTNIVTPTVTAVPRNEHWMKIFFRLQVHPIAVGSSDFCQNFRFTAPLVLFNLGAGIKREARGENCGHRFCPNLSITAKICAAAAL